MRYVVIGASAAGISGAKTLRELDKEAEIILVSKDENVYSGYTDTQKLVNFKGENIQPGDFVEVKILDAKTFSLDGVAV